MLNGQRLFDRNLVVKMDRFDKELEHKEGGLPRGLESIGMGLGAEGAPLSNVHGMFPGDASVPVSDLKQISSVWYILAFNGGFRFF